MRYRLVTAAAACVLISAVPARADVITNFGPGSLNSPGLSLTLDALGIPPNASSETTVESFVVPGAGSVDLTFTLQGDLGAFSFNFGYFDTSTVTANPVSQQELFATQALSGATLVFDDATHGFGDMVTTSVAGGTNLGFFIIPNNTLANFNANPSLFFPSQTSTPELRAPLFSVTGANPGGFDQMLSFLGGGNTLFAFEDLTRAGNSDNSFTDLVFSVDAQLQPVQSPEPGLLLLMGTGLAAAAARRRRRS